MQKSQKKGKTKLKIRIQFFLSFYQELRSKLVTFWDEIRDLSKGREELGIGLIYLSLKEIEARGEVGYGIVLKCIVGGFVGLISDDSTKKIHLFLNVLIE